jgi:hypothetical protein
MNERDRQMKPMTRQQALDKLAGAEYGRVVFTQHAMPAIRPVNHLLSDGRIIIFAHDDSAIAARADHGRGNVVVYEADQIDPRTRTGWSVTVTGLARLVEDPALIARYQQALRPWIAGAIGIVIGIGTDIVTGFEFTEADVGCTSDLLTAHLPHPPLNLPWTFSPQAYRRAGTRASAQLIEAGPGEGDRVHSVPHPSVSIGRRFHRAARRLPASHHVIARLPGTLVGLRGLAARLPGESACVQRLSFAAGQPRRLLIRHHHNLRSPDEAHRLQIYRRLFRSSRRLSPLITGKRYPTGEASGLSRSLASARGRYAIWGVAPPINVTNNRTRCAGRHLKDLTRRPT